MLGTMPPGCMEATHQPSKTVFRLHKTTVFRNGPGPSKVEKLILKAAPWELILVPTVAKLHKMMLKTRVDKCVDTCVDTVLTHVWNMCGQMSDKVVQKRSFGHPG